MIEAGFFSLFYGGHLLWLYLNIFMTIQTHRRSGDRRGGDEDREVGVRCVCDSNTPVTDHTCCTDIRKSKHLGDGSFQKTTEDLAGKGDIQTQPLSQPITGKVYHLHLTPLVPQSEINLWYDPR